MAVKNYGGDPATYHYSVSANSANLLVNVPRAIYVNGAGNLEIADSANNFLIYTVAAGQTIPFRALRIGSNTTANVVLLY